MAGYSVTFSVVDQATKQISAINKRIEQMRAPMERQARAVRQFADASGLKKVAEGFGEISHAGFEVFESLSRIVPVMGTLVGAASIAGIGELVEKWGAWGVELAHTADRVGLNTQTLEQFQNATKLAGGDVADMTESLKGLTDTAAGAFTGRNTDAIAWFNRAGISIRDANGHLRNTTELLPQVLRYLDGIKNPADRMTAALGLGGQSLYNLDEDFRRSGQTIDQWVAKAQKVPTLTAQQIAAEQRYKEAIGALDVAFSSLQEQIGATIATAITPLLVQFNDFVTQHSPQIIKAVNDITTAFGQWLQSDDAAHMLTGLEAIATTLGQIVKIIGDIAIAAAPLIKFLGMTPAEAAAGAAAAVGNKIGRPAPGQEYRGWGAAGDWVQRQLWPKQQFGPPAPAPAPVPTPAAPANENLPLGKEGALGGKNYANRAASLTAQLAKDLNLTPTQAAGIVGNLGYESGGLNPAAHEGGQPADKGGVGFAQWTGPRRREFEAYSKAAGLDPKTDAANVAFLEHELKGKYAYVVAALKKQTTLAGATSTVLNQYEKPADPSASASRRFDLAQKALDAALPQVAMAAPAEAKGKPAQVTGGPPVSGSVNVTVTHKNAPAGSFVTASATGNGVTVDRPRTEQQQLSAA